MRDLPVNSHPSTVNALWIRLRRFPALQTPHTLATRTLDARESAGLAERLGDPALVWYAASQLAIVHFEAGDLPESDRWFTRVAKLADDAGHRHFQWLATFMRAVRAQYAGRLAEAESLAVQALEHGDGSEHEAHPNFWFQLLQIRDDQGRLGEMAQPLAVGARGIDRPLLRAMLAHVACERGDHAEAHRLLQQDRFEAMPEDAVWPLTTTFFAETAAGVGDVASAARLLELLAPFRGQVAYSSNASRGAIARYTGLLAATLGRFDEAAADLERAAALHDATSAPVWLARTWLDAAHVEQARGGSTRRARELVARASHLAESHGALGVARRAATLAA